MPHSQIAALLDAWESHYVKAGIRDTVQVPIAQEDLLRLQALSEVYELPLDDILANLVSYALKEVEEKIPYRAGTRVIRVEEGEPIFEDVGRMPQYLQIKSRLEKQRQKQRRQQAH